MPIVYNPITDFLTKDTLPKEDPDKVILGADFSAEFDAISTAFLGAITAVDPLFSGTVTFEDATGDNLTLSTDLNVGGNAVVTGSLSAGSLTAGTATITGTLEAGNTTINGTLDATGVVTSGGEELLTEAEVLAIVSGAELGPITSLNDLSDVNVDSVADGETIVWDDANSEWIPLTGNLFINVDATSIKSDSFIETHATTSGAMNCASANNFSANLSGPMTVSLTNVPAVDGAYACTLRITANSNAVFWPTGTVWPEATAPTLSAGTDVFVLLTTDAGTTWYGFVAGQEIA